MNYDYQTERPGLFTERGQVMFLSIRDRTQRLLNEAGAATVESMIRSEVGGAWLMLACVDRMAELGEIREVTDPAKVAGQHRVFVRGW